ncbi:hypothetical protein [Robbsia andropogonis]|uniref:hypothetical protein n=1 Tax=Robbsia andropogonis TaxID=28092 RepID=UPI000A6986CB|nr:hypothetical protein [Robbsia andropogonis]
MMPVDNALPSRSASWRQTNIHIACARGGDSGITTQEEILNVSNTSGETKSGVCANINAQYSVRDGPSAWTKSTPLTSAIYLALRTAFVENFNVITSERVRFDQKVCVGNTTVTSEEFAVLMASALGRTLSDTVLQYMLDEMEAHTSRRMWDMCKIC